MNHKNRHKDAVVNAATGITLRALPRIPNRVKRLLLGGRSITIDGNTLDTTVQLLLAMQRVAGREGLVSSDDVVAARSQLDVLIGSLKQNINVAAVSDLSIPGPAGPILARHYRPDGGAAALLVFYHGGGFALGSIDTHDDQCRLISREAKLPVLSIGYRLAPENKFPAAVVDAFAAYRWAIDNAAELGADPKRIAVGGDSAGGTLAAVVSQLARDEGVQMPALQLLIYPATDYLNPTRSKTLFGDGFLLTNRDIAWFQHTYLDGADVEPSDPRVSPLLARDLSGLPPALVLTAGFDPLRDEGKQYVEAMQAAGVVVDHREFGSLVHGFTTFFPIGGDSAAATKEMICALRDGIRGGIRDAAEAPPAVS